VDGKLEPAYPRREQGSGRFLTLLITTLRAGWTVLEGDRPPTSPVKGDALQAEAKAPPWKEGGGNIREGDNVGYSVKPFFGGVGRSRARCPDSGRLAADGPLALPAPATLVRPSAGPHLSLAAGEFCARRFSPTMASGRASHRAAGKQPPAT